MSERKDKPAAKARAPRAAEAEDEYDARIFEELRYDVTQKLVRFAHRNQWPACPRRACRRSRQCAATDLICANPRPPRVLTAEEDAAMRARLLRDLRRRLAEVEREAG